MLCEFPTSHPNDREQTRLAPYLGSDLLRVDAHVVKPSEYKDLPELTDDMLSRAVVKKGGRHKSENPRQLISLRLPGRLARAPVVRASN